jgi:hypothetical protein
MVFDGVQAHGRQSLHLAAFPRHRGLIRTQRRSALHADHWPLFHHLIRRYYQSQRLATMAQLPPGFLPLFLRRLRLLRPSPSIEGGLPLL